MEPRPVGFWKRVAAFWIDALLTYVVVWAGEKLANYYGIYLPFEATFLILLGLQTIVLTAWLGGSVGKLACGQRVVRRDGRPVRWMRTLVRETLGKLVSLVALGLGFLWIGWTRSKRGWHDLLAGTCVQQRARLGIVRRLTLTVSFGTLLLAIAGLAAEWTSAVLLFRRMAPPQVAPLAFEQRDPKTLIDVSTLTQADHGRFLDWMDREGQPPLDYVIEKAQQHQVVIIGEIHEQRQLLEFFNELVPRLYHEAGVTRIAMECCPAARNADLQRLVTADVFDRELLLEIAREGAGGQPWGFREYWDVLESVWKLNRSLPSDAPWMLVVGLSPNLDQPSLVMLKDPNAPWWERLRVARAPREFDAMATADAFYARQIQQQIIEPGHRGVVWVGYAHACLEAPNTWARDRHAFPRMGFMLHQKYGDRLFLIRMHAPMLSAANVNQQASGTQARLPKFLDELFEEQNNRPVGFDVAESPFGPLRDETVWEDHMAPRLAMVDRAGGYVMLTRSDQLDKCRWIPGFITPEMFAHLKPYYQAMARREGKTVENADEFNAVFQSAAD